MKIEYKGVGYPCRILNILINDEPTEVVISVQSLSDAMGNKKEEIDCIEEAIDNDIYFYVEDAQITLSDAELALVLDEPYDLVPEPNTRVILELYLEIWYCYEDGKSMANPLFTKPTYSQITSLCNQLGLEIIQTIAFDNEESNLSNIKLSIEGNTNVTDFVSVLREMADRIEQTDYFISDEYVEKDMVINLVVS